MQQRYSRWSGPSLTRQKTAVIALTAVILGYSLYHICAQAVPASQSHVTAPPALRRSNARRRRRNGPRPRVLSVSQIRSRYPHDARWGSIRIDLSFLYNASASDEILAPFVFLSSTNRYLNCNLSRHLPTVEDIRQYVPSHGEAEELRDVLEKSFLTFYLWRHLPPTPINQDHHDTIARELIRDGNLSATSISTILRVHQQGGLIEEAEQLSHLLRHRIEESRYGGDTPLVIRPNVNHPAPPSPIPAEDQETVVETEGQTPSNGTTDGFEARKDGKDLLLNLVYQISEDQARKNAYVHRKVTCSLCNTIPITGIRYHCANCHDCDLCEHCEATQKHPKTHVFYKIRIPTPFMDKPRQPESFWYPGDPKNSSYELDHRTIKEISKRTEYEIADIEALWEQFTCLAAVDWPDDPLGYCLAIDRFTFDKCFVPQNSLRPAPPNLIFDRIFAFYDQNNDGLIGFEEFANGVATLNKTNTKKRPLRIFRGYDTNNDGFVDRKDFLRMLRAYYAITKELTWDVFTGMEEVPESGSREVILGNQPLSSAFKGDIPSGDPSRSGEGKSQDNFGDYRICDELGTFDDDEHDCADPPDTVADTLEAAQFGYVRTERSRRMDCGNLYDHPWPPQQVKMADVETVLGSEIPLEQVTALEDQRAIRRTAHARIAKCHQQRSKQWRCAVRDRKQKQVFYLDGEHSSTASCTPAPMIFDEGISDPLKLTYINDLKRVHTIRQSDTFNGFVTRRIVEMDWPVNSVVQTVSEIREMIMLEWTGLAIAEDLSGYAADFSECKKFVVESLLYLRDLAGSNASEKSNEVTTESAATPRRLQLTSKTRHERVIRTDGSHGSRSRTTSDSSRNIPIIEQWGGFDVPEPEKHVDREILYQVTQEAFNELLDPVFRLREDLSFAALQSKRVRECLRAETLIAVKEPVHFHRDLKLYQKRWLKSLIPDLSDEIQDFKAFLNKKAANIDSSTTIEECYRCAQNGCLSYIPPAGVCSKCGKVSSTFGSIMPVGNGPIPEETCRPCATKGQHSVIGGNLDNYFCNKCHLPSSFYLAETARIRKIIAGRSESFAIDTSSVNDDDSTVESLSKPYTKPDHSRVNDTDVVTPPPDPNLPQVRPDRADTPTPSGPFTTDTPPTDPTLPQNRTNSDSQDAQPSRTSPKERPSGQDEVPSLEKLRFYAALNLIEHEDNERGGPGRLSFEEFQDVMQGQKGQGLGFLESWLDMVGF